MLFISFPSPVGSEVQNVVENDFPLAIVIMIIIIFFLS